MLSDEEKEALEILNNTEWDGFMITIKNLIEKQQKEIKDLKEELNKKPIFLIKDLYNRKLKEISLQDTAGLIVQGKKEMLDKIKAKIEELEIEQESNREDFKIAIDNLLFQNIDKIGNRISINMSVREILQSLLEKE